jgi:hypothetical protein
MVALRWVVDDHTTTAFSGFDISGAFALVRVTD